MAHDKHCWSERCIKKPKGYFLKQDQQCCCQSSFIFIHPPWRTQMGTYLTRFMAASIVLHSDLARGGPSLGVPFLNFSKPLPVSVIDRMAMPSRHGILCPEQKLPVLSILHKGSIRCLQELLDTDQKGSWADGCRHCPTRTRKIGLPEWCWHTNLGWLKLFMESVPAKNMSGAWGTSKISILKFLRNCMLSYTEKITTLQSYFGRKYPKGFMGPNQLFLEK